MDTKEISDLLKLINKSSLTDVEIEKKDFNRHSGGFDKYCTVTNEDNLLMRAFQ